MIGNPTGSPAKAVCYLTLSSIIEILTIKCSKLIYDFNLETAKVIHTNNLKTPIILSPVSNAKISSQAHFIFSVVYYYATCPLFIDFSISTDISRAFRASYSNGEQTRGRKDENEADYDCN
jgi:hypothetical protein